MVRLSRLRIDRFRNVKPGTDLRFGPTFNVFLGKNATGKTTLLDLVAAVTNDDLSAYATEDGGFDLTWWLDEGEYQIEVRAVRTPARSEAMPDAVSELRVREFDEQCTIVLRTAGVVIAWIEVKGTRGVLKPQGEADVLFEVRAGLAAGRASQRALFAVYQVVAAQNEGTPETPVASRLRLALRMVPGGRVGRLDEAVASLDAIVRSPFEVRRAGNRNSGGSFGAWLPSAFALAIHQRPSSGQLIVHFNRLGPLSPVPALLGFASAELRPRILKQSQDGEKVSTFYQGFDCLFQRADGSQVSHELLSFGQKRLFSFLWYLTAREGLPVVVDELLNGLHHDWIEVCLDRLYERQSFLATQHPYLLDHIPIENADSVRTSFIRCTLEPGPDGRDQMAWRNFTEEEAERFFTAFQTGIQQVSEVLRTEGLW